jgi:hypothetical protein
MPRGWLLGNAVLAGIALLLAAGIMREVTRSRPLAPPVATPLATAVKAGAGDVGSEPKPLGPLAALEPVAARNLFSAARSETMPVTATLAPRAKPILHGVVVFGDQSRAYLEDPALKRVYGYAVGDTLAGGRLELIADDRAVIRMPEGVIEVLLKDPAKPRPGPARAAATTAAAPAAAASPIPPAPPTKGAQ